MLSQVPDRVSVYEVSPRDGLQNEPAPIPLEAKKHLLEALFASGLRRIELTSFVSPRWVPQLADADELCTEVTAPAGVTLSALCPNAKGFERAKAAGLREIAVFMSASETHNRKNVNKSVAATLLAFDDVIAPARRAGMQVRGYVSTVWGCPYEGAVDPEAALRIAHELLSRGCYQVSLGDTIGVGTPLQTRRILEVFLREIPAEKIALHLHDTRGMGIANAYAGLEMGVNTFDAAVAGLGGCPFAGHAGAAGNVCTADLVFMCDEMGIETGVNLEALMESARLAEDIVGHPLPGSVMRGGSLRALRAQVAAAKAA